CLNSVPLAKDGAIDLVDANEPYPEWQSDSAYKADPPPDYFFPAYDMLAALARVKANLEADKYNNEVQFQRDLYLAVFAAGHDGHLVFYPDALTRVFNWKRQRTLVSVSQDGPSLPVIKLYGMFFGPEQRGWVVSDQRCFRGCGCVTRHGFSSEAHQTPFLPQNIIFLTDGTCASTCALTSSMLRLQAGVKSIVLGGRSVAELMQAVRGVKGAQVLSFRNIYDEVTAHRELAEDEEQRKALERYSDGVLKRSTASAVNARNQILRGGAGDGVPAQFVKEEVDCRLWWTEGMVGDVGEVWRAAASAALKEGRCVSGGIDGEDNGEGLRERKRESGRATRPRPKKRFTDLRGFYPPVDNAGWHAIHKERVIT
ncbi:hypothetical protein B0H67DRAFT_655280, partial [Lasiosphaeris hirsuta]